MEGKNNSATQYALTDEIDVPTGINAGLSTPGQDFMISMLGEPRTEYSQVCQPVSNKTLATLMQTANVGPFNVTGLRAAIESLRTIMTEIKNSHPDVYAKLGTAGMLCCRKQRGSSKISNHSWGTAIDLKLDGKLDVRGNKKVHYGLSLIAPIFNKHGWIWGAAFRTEDAMHFEVSKIKLEQWKALQKFGSVAKPVTLKRGDNGKEVRLLQEKLNQKGARLKLDGDFGGNTELAVIAFQKKFGLKQDGLVGPKTRKLLGI